MQLQSKKDLGLGRGKAKGRPKRRSKNYFWSIIWPSSLTGLNWGGRSKERAQEQWGSGVGNWVIDPSVGGREYLTCV